MARYAKPSSSTINTLSGVVTPSSDMPITGKFGMGKVVFFTKAGATNFVIPDGITSVRARMWGGGSSAGMFNENHCSGSGGGFAMKTISGLTPLSTVVVTVAAAGGTSSFGSHVSATGGVSGPARAGGVGVGGDINTKGGLGNLGGLGGGGGAASVIGDGGKGGKGGSEGGNDNMARGGAGGGASGGGYQGGNGFTGRGGAGGMVQIQSGGSSYYENAGDGEIGEMGIDYIGTGGGGGGGNTTGTAMFAGNGANGGGGGVAMNGGNGGFPGGGGGMGSNGNIDVVGVGAPGLVVLEY